MLASSLSAGASGTPINVPTAVVRQTQTAPVSGGKAGAAGDSTVISTLARQLGNAAARAAVRDASMSEAALGTLAQNILHSVYDYDPLVNEEPRTDTDDPALLARSAQAAQHYRELYGDAFPRTTPNPFANLPSDQLLLIAYDQGPDFTLGERAVALHEYNRREEEWASRMIDRVNAEFAATGNLFHVHKESYEFFKSLPLIEQARWGGDIREAGELYYIARSINELGENAESDNPDNWFRRFVTGASRYDGAVPFEEFLPGFLQEFRQALHGRDPFEAMFGAKGRTLNEFLDGYQLPGGATADVTAAPAPVQTGVTVFA